MSRFSNYSGRRGKKRSASSKRAIISRKPSGRNQKFQILSLKKAIDNNTRLINGQRYKVVHKTRLALDIIGTPANPYRVLQLNAPSLMQQIFSAPSESAGGKYNFDRKGRTHLTFNIVSNNEPSPLPLQIFILSCKNSKVALETGISTLPTTMTLTADVDYISNLGAATFINLKRFNCHKHWMVNLGPIQAAPSGVPLPWQGDLHPIKRTFNMKNPLVLNNRTGIWSSTPDNGVNPNQRLFMVVFNNNVSTTSTFPILNGLVVHTAWTSE